MPTYVDRNQTIDLLRSTWEAIDHLYTGFTDADHDTPTCLPGWTVKDQLSHITGAEEMLLGQPIPEVDVSHLTHLHNDIAKMNEAWVESKRSLSGPEVLAQFRTATAARLTALDAMSQANFDAPSWTPAGPDETYGRFMRIRAYDSFHHEHDARDALGLPARLDPAAIRSALDETFPALGYIVGKRAKLPKGARVRIELTGPGAATHLIEVTDRARVVDELSGDPTVELRVDGFTFVRLTGGRIEAEPLIGSTVALAGDEVQGRQLIANLAFTI